MGRQKNRFLQVLGNERRRFADWGVALFLVCAPLWVFPLSFSPYIAKTGFVAMGIAVLLFVSGVVWWTRREATIRLPWVFVGIAFVIVASLASLFQASNWAYALVSLLLLVLFAGFGLLVANLGDRETARRLLAALLIAGVASFLFGILQYAGVLGDPLLSPIERLSGTFGNRNYLGSFLGVIAFPVASLLWTRRWKFSQVLLWLGVTLCFLGPALIQQLGVLVALMAGALFLVAATFVFRLGRFVRSHWKPALAIALAALTGLGAGLGLWLSQPIVPIQQSSSSFIADVWAANSGRARQVDWATAWEMFVTHPATGVGIGNYKVRYIDGKILYVSAHPEDAEQATLPRAAQSHNDYLQELAEMGVVGGIAILATIVLLISTSWMRCRSMDPGPRQMEFLFLLAGVVVAGVHATVSFPFHLPATGLAVVTLLGLASSGRFGDRAVWQRRLSVRATRGTALVVLLLTCLIGILGVREFVAHVSYTHGVSQMDAGDLRQAQSSFVRSAATSLFVTDANFRLASVALLRSDTARQRGDATEAAALVELAQHQAQLWCAAYPTEQGLLLLAGIEVLQKEYDTAEQVLVRLLDSRPKSVFGNDARYLLAVIAAQNGRVQEARAALQALIEDQPTYLQSYILLGRLLIQAGDADAATQILQQGLQIANDELYRMDAKLASADHITLATLQSDRQRLVAEKQTLASLLSGL